MHIKIQFETPLSTKRGTDLALLIGYRKGNEVMVDKDNKVIGCDVSVKDAHDVLDFLINMVGTPNG